MQWIKRNVFLVMSGVVALVLMGGSLYYLFGSIGKNRDVESRLEEMQKAFDKLYNMNPFPEMSNITTARKEVAKVKEAVGAAKKFFQMLPATNVTGLEFKTLLDNTIFELTQQAQKANVTLPDSPYHFSFAAQKEKLNLSPECFPGITEQLAEVRGICQTIFPARIHALTALKRARLTSDDPPGSKDYTDEWPTLTNAVTGAVISHYEVSFTGFSSDLAAVLHGFATSPHGFVVRALQMDRLETRPETKPTTLPVPKPTVPPPPPKENLTVLDEERFHTTILLAVVKPKP